MTATPSRIDTLGYGLALFGAALFSTKGIFIKLAFAEGISVEAVLALRMLLALPVYLVIMASILFRNPDLRGRLTPRIVLASMAVGAIGYYLASYLDFAGLAFVSAQYERLVLFTYPFFVLLFGVWFFGESMNWRLVPPMLLTYCGLLVIFVWNLAVNPDGLLIGTLLVLGSALTFALYQHLARSQMRLIGAALFTCIAMSSAAFLAIAQGLIVDGPAAYIELSPYVWLLGLMLGIFGTILPSFLINIAIDRIGPQATSSTASFGPIITIALAVFVLNEPFTWVHALGTLLVLIGTWLFARLESRSRTVAE